MPTRADFYIGTGESMEWLGSIAFDGYREGISDELLNTTTEEAYRAELVKFFEPRSDVTLPSMGWPWPWDSSHTTDRSYTFSEGLVLESSWGHAWMTPAQATDEDFEPSAEKIPFPDMSNRKSVTFGRRSGLIVLGGPS